MNEQRIAELERKVESLENILVGFMLGVMKDHDAIDPDEFNDVEKKKGES